MWTMPAGGLQGGNLKRRILGLALLGLSTASFMFCLHTTPREHAYGLLSLSYLLFIAAVFTMMSRVTRSRVTSSSGNS